MIQNNESNNKIKENKYKILRMSLLLGNGEDKDETINNFEDAAREIDAMNDKVYLKDLESKFYDTLTLEEEEKKLAALVDYIGGRVEQRISLLEDFNNVTGYELTNLPTIKYEERLEEYKNRLYYIREYLNNNKDIERLNKEIDELENELNDSFVNKAKAEDRNNQFEEELTTKFNNIIIKRKEFKDLNKENAELKLSDIKNAVDDSKNSLDIFNKSFRTLNDAGISGEEREEYLSYVNNAKEVYYNNKELEYLIRLYIIINTKENEYQKIIQKRDSINDITYERQNLRKDLKIMTEDILDTLYPTLSRQYEDIIKQRDNIENIDNLNSEINNRKDLVSELEKDNQKVEILSLLKEFCIIDTYDDNDNMTEEINKEENIQDDLADTFEEKVEQNQAEDNNQDIFNNTEESEDIKAEDNNDFNLDFDNKETVENNSEEETPKEEVIEEPEDNQVIMISDADKINLEEAVTKSNNVMRRVGDMLGVKVEPEEKPQEEKTEEPKVEENQPEEPTPVEEPVLPHTTQESIETPDPTPSNEELPTPEEPAPASEDEKPDNNTPNNNTEDFEVNNIFMNDNFDADPETNSDKPTEETPSALPENPLFNNSLGDKTIDDIMAENKNIDDNDSNNFWFPQEEAPLDLNSLPDINSNEEQTNNIFFEDNNSNNTIPNLDFPTLEGQETSTIKEEE